MAIIYTRKGQEILVDDDDFEALNAFKWFVKRYKNKNGTEKLYAARTVGLGSRSKKTTVFMHRQITGAPKGMDVDHWDHNGLNNQRGNLRVATRSQNMCNARFEEKELPTGVRFHPLKNKYQAQVWLNGKSISLGYYKDIESAAEAYEDGAQKYHGEFSRLNKAA